MRKSAQDAVHLIAEAGQQAGKGFQNPAAVRRNAGATFSALSLSGLSHNDCKRWAFTKRSAVRILFAEPNDPATNSLRFWLTARRRGLAGSGQYCGKRLLSCPAI